MPFTHKKYWWTPAVLVIVMKIAINVLICVVIYFFDSSLDHDQCSTHISDAINFIILLFLKKENYSYYRLERNEEIHWVKWADVIIFVLIWAVLIFGGAWWII